MAVLGLVASLLAAQAAATCPDAPASGCRVAHEARLSIWNRADDAKDQLLWKWSKGEALNDADLGDPLGGTGYALCLYAGSAQALVGEAAIPAGGDWRALEGLRFLYKAPGGQGMRFTVLQGGDAGATAALAKGKGVALPDPPLPLAAPVTVQLMRDDAPLCLGASFAAAEENDAGRYKAVAQATVPSAPGTIAADDRCNKSGDDGSLAEQVGAQMRRSGTEWASTCLAAHGSLTAACEVAFPGDSSFASVPDAVPSLVCPNVDECDYSLGRIEWHAEDKFVRKCSLDQWRLAWNWIRQRAGAAAPPDCDVGAFAPGFWGVYACYEQHFVQPLLARQLARLRGYESPHPPMTPACEATIVNRLWWRLASDWIRHGDDVCAEGYFDRQMQRACGTDSATPKIDQATWEAWCGEDADALRPVYEGVRAASGKPY